MAGWKALHTSSLLFLCARNFKNFNSYLFSELLLAQLVQREKLSCQGDVLQESAAGQLHSDDDLTIRDHHGHVPELNLS